MYDVFVEKAVLFLWTLYYIFLNKCESQIIDCCTSKDVIKIAHMSYEEPSKPQRQKKSLTFKCTVKCIQYVSRFIVII